MYCASSIGVNPIYRQIAQETGKALANRNIRLVYGGGNGGLMGEVADAVLANGGQVTGIIPHFLADLEVAHQNLTEIEFVETMHQRKSRMVALSDGVITLPGGYGTLDELFEILAWRQLKIFHGPIGVLNANGFYDALLLHADRMTAEGFLKPENRKLILVADTIDGLLTKMGV